MRAEEKARQDAAKRWGLQGEELVNPGQNIPQHLKTRMNQRQGLQDPSNQGTGQGQTEGGDDNPNTPFANALRKKKQLREEKEPDDSVKLHEQGWKERYYQQKFNVSSKDENFKRHLVKSYTEGLSWVLGYYFQGCQSWNWYFPYHYAPFASDFKGLTKMTIEWPLRTMARSPLEQLMCVFPAASKQFLPASWAELMHQDRSPIIDFYPTDFKIDMNGKKFEWMGVALLPFVDEPRLKRALKKSLPKSNPRRRAPQHPRRKPPLRLPPPRVHRKTGTRHGRYPQLGQVPS